MSTALWFAALRFRLGRWLIRPHVTALLEHYNAEAENLDNVNRDRCSYIGLGLRYAIGIGKPWNWAKR